MFMPFQNSFLSILQIVLRRVFVKYVLNLFSNRRMKIKLFWTKQLLPMWFIGDRFYSSCDEDLSMLNAW